MILEQQDLLDRIQMAIAESLVPAAVHDPGEFVTWVVPHDADGDLVVIDGVIDINVLAHAIVDEVWPDVVGES